MGIQDPYRLLLVIPVALWYWWYHRHSDARIPNIKGKITLILSFLSAALLVFALCHPYYVQFKDPAIEIIMLVDGSKSVSEKVLVWAQGLLADLKKAVSDNVSIKSAVFAENLEFTDILKRPDKGGDKTDIGKAISQVLSLPSNAEIRRILLITDGGDTEGGGSEWAEYANKAGVRIDVAFPETLLDPEFVLEKVYGPKLAFKRRPIEVKGIIRGSTRGKIRCEARIGKDVYAVNADFAPPTTDVVFSPIYLPPDADQWVEIQVSCYPLELGIDTYSHNNMAIGNVMIAKSINIQCIESFGSQCEKIKTMLSDVADVKTFSKTPKITEEKPDIVIFGNLDKFNNLQPYLNRITQLGTGVLFMGGKKALSLSDLAGSAVERDFLPVKMVKKTQESHPQMAVLFLLDRSASMGGKKMGMAKAAIVTSAKSLPPDALVGLIAFDEKPRKYLDLTPVGNGLGIDRAVQSVTLGGGTNLRLALEMARDMMIPLKAGDKLIILVTDGSSPRKGLIELARFLGIAGIRISTIAIGSDADGVLLSDISRLSGGRAHYAPSPDSVPSLMLSEMKRPDMPPIATGSFRIVPEKGRIYTGLFRGVDQHSLPKIDGYVLVQERKEGEVLARVEKGDIIFAIRHVNNAVVGVFTPGLNTEWMSNLLGSQEGAKFIANAIKIVGGESGQIDVRLATSIDEEKISVNVDCLDNEGQGIDNATVKAKIKGPQYSDGVEVSLVSKGLGRYEAVIPLSGDLIYGSYLVEVNVVAGGVTDKVVGYANLTYSKEMAHFGIDYEKTREIASKGGGKLNPTLQDLAKSEIKSLVKAPLAPHLILASLVLFLCGIWVRRI